MLDRRRDALEDLREETPLHDVRLRIGDLDTVVRNEAMLAGEVAGSDSIDDNVNRVLENFMAYATVKALRQLAERCMNDLIDYDRKVQVHVFTKQIL